MAVAVAASAGAASRRRSSGPTASSASVLPPGPKAPTCGTRLKPTRCESSETSGSSPLSSATISFSSWRRPARPDPDAAYRMVTATRASPAARWMGASERASGTTGPEGLATMPRCSPRGHLGVVHAGHHQRHARRPTGRRPRGRWPGSPRPRPGARAPAPPGPAPPGWPRRSPGTTGRRRSRPPARHRGTRGGPPPSGRSRRAGARPGSPGPRGPRGRPGPRTRLHPPRRAGSASSSFAGLLPEQVAESRLERRPAESVARAPGPASARTRWLASTTSAISPSTARTAKAGATSRLGRRSTRPSDRARSRFRTGSGAVALTGPWAARILEREAQDADLVGDVDPGLPEVRRRRWGRRRAS